MFPCVVQLLHVSLCRTVTSCFLVVSYSYFMFPCCVVQLLHVSLLCRTVTSCFLVVSYSYFMFPCCVVQLLHVSLLCRTVTSCFLVVSYSYFMFPCCVVQLLHVSLLCRTVTSCFLVVSYSYFMFPCCVVQLLHVSLLCRTVTSCFLGLQHPLLPWQSMKASLSVFTLFLTAYCSWAAAFAALAQLLFSTAFFSFLACTLLRVSAEIHSFYCFFFFSQDFLTCAGPCLHDMLPLGVNVHVFFI